MKGLIGITKREVAEIFSKAKAILIDDHFVYAKKADGWYHGSAYVNKDAIYPYTRLLRPLCKSIADNFQGNEIEVVVGPTIGAVSLSQWVAHFCAPSINPEEVLAVFAEEEEVLELQVTPIEQLHEQMYEYKTRLEDSRRVILQFDEDLSLEQVFNFTKIGTRRVLKRGYAELVRGKRCLIVEDIINSGATVRKVIEAVLKANGKVVGVGALCNRSGGKVTDATLGVTELYSLYDLSMEMYPEDDCPICREKGFASVRTDLGKGFEFLARKGISKAL